MPEETTDAKSPKVESASGAFKAQFLIDSVLPTGGQADTSTVVLRADDGESAIKDVNGKFFHRPSGRIELNNVRNEVADKIREATRVVLTIEPRK